MPTLAKAPKKGLTKAQDNERKVVYPRVQVNGIEIPIEKLKITAAKMRQLLGWEDEDDYTNRMIQSTPGAKAAQFKYGDAYLVKDEHGRKVRCWNNEVYGKNKEGGVVLTQTNRALDLGHLEKITQDILTRRWRFNGEAMIVSDRAMTISLQHRGIALIKAVQRWEKNPVAYEQWWKEEPYIEAIVVTGISGDAETLMTLDNVKPRSLDDVVYTSELFANLNAVDRKECSRMLGKATGLIWRRVGAGDGPVKMIQTHSASMDFIERHPHLKKAVKHIFEENRTRKISSLRMHSGECAGLLYLMGTGKSDFDAWRNADPPSEKELNLDNWDKACDFWVELAAGQKEGKLVRKALAALVDLNEGNEGRKIEKFAVIVKAWQVFEKGYELTETDLKLDLVERPDGGWALPNPPTCGGIDLGDKPEKVESSPTEEEVEAAKVEERKKRAEELARKAAEAKAKKEAKLSANGRKVDGLTDAGRKAQAVEIAKARMKK